MIWVTRTFKEMTRSYLNDTFNDRKFFPWELPLVLPFCTTSNGTDRSTIRSTGNFTSSWHHKEFVGRQLDQPGTSFITSYGTGTWTFTASYGTGRFDKSVHGNLSNHFRYRHLNNLSTTFLTGTGFGFAVWKWKCFWNKDMQYPSATTSV